MRTIRKNDLSHFGTSSVHDRSNLLPGHLTTLGQTLAFICIFCANSASNCHFLDQDFSFNPASNYPIFDQFVMKISILAVLCQSKQVSYKIIYQLIFLFNSEIKLGTFGLKLNLSGEQQQNLPFHFYALTTSVVNVCSL